jgi:hypothetical protein
MRLPTRSFAFFLCALSFPPALACGQETAAPERGAQDLAALADEVLPDVERLRGLEFKEPVVKKGQTKEGFRDFLLAALEKEMNPKVWEPRERFYKRLGLLPGDVSLRASVEALLLEQVGGYYDPETRALYLVGSFGPTIDRTILAHEIGHALDDQHFDLRGRMEAVRNEEDRGFATSSVLEGSATLLMGRYVAKYLLTSGLEPEEIVEEMQGQEAFQAEQFRRAPPYLQRGLLLTYLEGQKFLSKGVLSPIPDVRPELFETAFRYPPLSSEQILHPEKYWEAITRDEPIEVVLPEFGASLGEAWTKADESTLGEIYTAILTEDPDDVEEIDVSDVEGALALMGREWTNAGAAGWGGDRFAVYVNGDRLVGVWLAVWDDAGEAEEFEEALEEAGHEFFLRRAGDRVVVVVGDVAREGPGSFEALAAKALREAKTTRPEPREIPEPTRRRDKKEEKDGEDR